MKKIISLFSFFCFSISLQAQPPIGIQAPEINLKDVDGNNISLNSLKGKVVVIDFWASWCGPCRAANKTLRKLYSKYKEQGLEIYSIACEDTKPNWKQAIKADKITWLQVFDEGSIVSNKWRIGYLPFTFLLDKTGKIVAADIEAKELEVKIKALL
jgi:thiol-disulfide isomerase/thioredoxin